MPTKTISLTVEAYARLRAARRTPDESFSRVVMRAEWRGQPATAGELLTRWRSEAPHFSAAGLDAIEALSEADAPPDDKWTRPPA